LLPKKIIETLQTSLFATSKEDECYIAFLLQKVALDERKNDKHNKQQKHIGIDRGKREIALLSINPDVF